MINTQARQIGGADAVEIFADHPTVLLRQICLTQHKLTAVPKIGTAGFLS